MSNDTQPEIRFPGFTEDWEQRKLGDFIDVKSGKDYKHLNSGSIPVYGTGGYMLSVDRALSDIDAIGIGRKGTIDKPYLLKAPFWTVDTLFYAVPKQNIDLQFSLSIFKKINWKKFDESTGVPSLSKTVINSVGTSVPSYEEQQKIGSFFKQLDDTIALHQRKLDLLKETKKGFLQKMFPKNGAKVPEIRFPGFTENWEEKKFKEVINSGIKGKAKAEMSGTKSLYLDTNYLNGGVVTYVDSPRDVENDDVLILWDGSQAGTVYYGFSGALGSTLKAYRAKESGAFLYQQLKRNQQIIYDRYRTPNIPHVVKTFTDEFMVSMPSSEEQQKIGSFFKQLDDTIALHQRKLDLLKETKKGFLQKMFV